MTDTRPTTTPRTDADRARLLPVEIANVSTAMIRAAAYRQRATYIAAVADAMRDEREPATSGTTDMICRALDDAAGDLLAWADELIGEQAA